MNYEEMYQNLQPAQKDLKDALALLQRLYKTVCKEAESGDVKSLLKDLNAMKDSAALLAGALGNLEETVSGFNARAYFESGENSLLRYDPMLTTCIICTGSLIRKEGLVINKNEITTCPSNSQKLHSKFVRGTYAYCPNCTDYYIWIKKDSYGVICTAGLHNSETFY